MDGVEFLSLPPIHYHRGGIQLPNRAVLGGKRPVSLIAKQYPDRLVFIN